MQPPKAQALNAALALLARWSGMRANATTAITGQGGALASPPPALTSTSARRSVHYETARGSEAAARGGGRAAHSTVTTTAPPPSPTASTRRQAFASSAPKGSDDDSNPKPAAASTSTPIDPELLSLLACPLTKQPLEVVQGREGQGTASASFLLSRASGARFPVGRDDGVPRLRPLQDGEVVAVVGEEEDDEQGR